VFAGHQKSWEAFLESASGLEKKMQIGVRGKKIDPNWIAVDLFDDSPNIDYRYDVQNLLFEDSSFDCIVCNAVLEHVPHPHLALYELYRVLKPGGSLWLEVPFLQAYHAHPHDYWRCTLPGIRTWCEDFEEVSAGIFEGFAHEAGVLLDIWSQELDIPQEERRRIRPLLTGYIEEVESSKGTSGRLYMATFYHGRKPMDRPYPEPKRTYMEYLKRELQNSE
jgi:SAM-dependent methyltransferase